MVARLKRKRCPPGPGSGAEAGKRRETREELQRMVDEAVDTFQEAQFLEDGGEVAAAAKAYEGLVGKLERLLGARADDGAGDVGGYGPPLNIVASSSANCLGGLELEAHRIKPARRWFAKALRLWPGNAMAQLNLANLEREHGDQAAAVKLYESVAALGDCVQESEGTVWSEIWVERPKAHCVALASYTMALINHQLGNYEKAIPLLQRFGLKHRVAPAVWQTAARMRSSEVAQIATAEEAFLSVSPVPVTLRADVVPEPILSALREAFAPSSQYWVETDYKERGYYSFWYDVERGPTNLVELAIRWMLAQTRREDIVGAEWWVHSRKSGRNLGHQLHFDMEENTLELHGKVVHPVVSSVTYLTGAEHGGCTVVFDQAADAVEGASRAVVAKPHDGAMLTFPGNALHGVLPGNSAAPRGSPQRLTLMVGFWTEPVFKTGKRTRLGPCSLFPPATRSCSWPSILDIPPGLAKLALSSFPGPDAEDVQHGPLLPVAQVCAPWEALPACASPALEVPVELDQRFFIRSFSSLQPHSSSADSGSESS